jgi:hypothetical protein
MSFVDMFVWSTCIKAWTKAWSYIWDTRIFRVSTVLSWTFSWYNMITYHFSWRWKSSWDYKLTYSEYLISHTQYNLLQFCSNIILGIYALEETGNCDSFWIPWCQVLTHVCW